MPGDLWRDRGVRREPQRRSAADRHPADGAGENASPELFVRAARQAWNAEDSELAARLCRHAAEQGCTEAAALLDEIMVFRLGLSHDMVVHTTGRIRKNPHVTVVWPSTDPLNQQIIPWPSEVSVRFDACFNEEK
ncbi:hypothetical protein GCM10009555_013630 [Acrocarpospora macrocephala]|uniref:Uncharacterized protein n=1 Tax=Acrocarpospora macrocephala TaxID=150177 RepID=A0A5M3WJG2_9ACTN|nr:hypothetical protein Amac_017670 [Acrocarpospora macrocephala]